MEINYALEPEDLWRFNKLLIKRVPAYKFRFLFRLVTIPVATLLLFLSQQFASWVCLAATVCVAFVWIAFCAWSLKRHYLKGIQEQPGLLGKKELEINPAGIQLKASIADSFMPWNAFSEIVEDKDQILFFVNPKYAVVIPKHAFSGQEEANRFFTSAQAYWKEEAVLSEPDDKAKTWPPPPRSRA